MNSSKNSKYYDDTVIQNVNRFVTLSKRSKKINTPYLNFLMDHLLLKMKEKDWTFNLMYNSIMYGGSYYKGTKIGEPDEYDLDLIIKLQETPLKIETSKTLGYVKIRRSDHRVDICKDYHGAAFDRFINEEGYLDQDKFRSWLESVTSKVIESLPEPSDLSTNMQVSIHKSGPAQTLGVYIPTIKKSNLNVDLVLCLKFSLIKPPSGFNYFYGSWLAIPKPLPGVYEGNLLWRACFYEQEKELLRSKMNMKTAFRLLKKLRDTQQLSSLSSYYIETLFRHEIKSQDASFWELNSLTYLFIHMLKKLQKAAKDHRITSYWCTEMNLLENISKETMESIANRLQTIVNKIDSTIESDPLLIIARFILNEKELKEMRNNSDQL